MRIPYRDRRENLSAGQQSVNRSQAKIRTLVEQAMASLKTWRLLHKLRCSTTCLTSLVQAVLALHLTSSERGRKSLKEFEGAYGSAGTGMIRHISAGLRARLSRAGAAPRRAARHHTLINGHRALLTGLDDHT